ncbi:WD repeat-containing protein 5 [Hondaea fermentalgiana]|uniref:WD repeat-containing protein 5 n=1 Tax=Hondaea fermentalgiana TaxID=2315210 RepID=A0A2R5GL65_9STRA|nr:WD repeat-containing protein 5 [Hondaea fermentalgiana]|eukprot:GBG31627.1 WD repeat-containing protein 5 [Hondaea fermentalgiana]
MGKDVKRMPRLQLGLSHVLRGHRGSVSCVKFSPDGDLLATASVDGLVILWDGVSGAYVRTLEGHQGGVSTVAWSPDGVLLCSASDDRTVRLWEAATGRIVRTLVGHHNIVFAVDYSPTGDLIATGSFDCTIRIWNAQTGRCIRTIRGHTDPVTAVNFNRDGSLLVSGGFDGLVRIWDTNSGQCHRSILQNHNPPVSSATFSPNGKFVLVGTFGGTLQLWNYAQTKVLKRYRGHLHERFCLQAGFAVHQGAAAIMSGSEDGVCYLWDLQTKRVTLRLEGHSGPVVAIDSHPKLPIVVSAELASTTVSSSENEAGSEKAQNAQDDEMGTIRLWQPPKQQQQVEGDENRLADAASSVPVVIRAPAHTPSSARNENGPFQDSPSPLVLQPVPIASE